MEDEEEREGVGRSRAQGSKPEPVFYFETRESQYFQVCLLCVLKPNHTWVECLYLIPSLHMAGNYGYLDAINVSPVLMPF